jgi:hypothetical protein
MLILPTDFNHMQKLESYIKTKQQQKQMKYKLLEMVESVYGDSFDRLKTETRSAIDTLCFLATDKGFVYAKDTYFADKHNISARTIRRVMKTLEDAGKVVKKHRSSSKYNGRGAAVYFFVDHPHFAHWSEYFAFDVQTDVQTENAEIPCESKDKEEKKVSTYYLPKNQKIKDHLMYSINFIKGVPKFINETFINLFNESLKDLYTRICIAYKKASTTLPKEQRQHIAYQSIKALSTYVKKGSMSLEEQCKLVYKIALNKFEATAQSKDEIKEKHTVNNQNPVRKEMLPEWFQEQQKNEELKENHEEVYEGSEEDAMAEMKAILAHYQ